MPAGRVSRKPILATGEPGQDEGCGRRPDRDRRRPEGAGVPGGLHAEGARVAVADAGHRGREPLAALRCRRR